MTDFLSQLNDSQRAAVEYLDGPSLVIAGAGSGKTRVLTYKIAHLLQYGMEPWAILALTFTNKAAREMKDRIAALVGNDRARYLHMGTFHSVFSHILRVKAELLGYDSRYTIYDQSDSESLLRKIIKDEQLDDKIYKLKDVAGRISRAKNQLITPEAYRLNAEYVKTDISRSMPAVAHVYALYQARLRQANAMDFDDLLLNTYLLFRQNEDVRQEYAGRYKFVLVDEYQDTNYAQKEIVWQLTKERKRVCVVGDDAQSIYSFRGAQIRNILDFQTTYAPCKLFKLEENYRSTHNIVGAADSLIAHNSEQIRKHCVSMGVGGDKVQMVSATSDQEEAVLVCQQIDRLHKAQALPYDGFAILYRTNAQSRSFEEQLRKDNIPYRIFGGLSFYQRKEIKDIVAYYRLVDNPNDEEAFRRVINYPKRGIGETTVSRLAQAAAEAGVSLWAMACSCNKVPITPAASRRIIQFTEVVKAWQQRAATENAYTLGESILKQSGMNQEIFSGRDPEDLARQQNIQEFIAALNSFVEERQETGEEDVSLSAYLQDISLLTDADTKTDDNTPRISLMTIHSAKGLEFDTVFVVGVEENIFPLPQATTTLRDLEEERRLLYVAVTRAKTRCYITYARYRFRWGHLEFDNPSRFLREFDGRFVEGANTTDTNVCFTRKYNFTSKPATKASIDLPVWSEGRRLRRVAPQTEESGQSAGEAPVRAGQRIEHNRFGKGTILSVEGAGEGTKIKVEFERAGQKLLLLKFAKYNIIE